jgi:hypothetical protein
VVLYPLQNNIQDYNPVGACMLLLIFSTFQVRQIKAEVVILDVFPKALSLLILLQFAAIHSGTETIE